MYPKNTENIEIYSKVGSGLPKKKKQIPDGWSQGSNDDKKKFSSNIGSNSLTKKTSGAAKGDDFVKTSFFHSRALVI